MGSNWVISDASHMIVHASVRNLVETVQRVRPIVVSLAFPNQPKKRELHRALDSQESQPKKQVAPSLKPVVGPGPSYGILIFGGCRFGAWLKWK